MDLLVRGVLVVDELGRMGGPLLRLCGLDLGCVSARPADRDSSVKKGEKRE